ncbi:MAG TPA: zf-HC2 domain-containing protein [Bacteroidota bacterium]
MNHTMIHRMLSAYADGEVSMQESDAVRQHVGDCVECQRALKELKLVGTEIRRAADVELSNAFEANLLRATRSMNDAQVVWSGADLFARRLVLALTVIVFFIVSVGSLNSSEPSMVIEPGLSGVSADSTVQQTLLHGEVSEDDFILAVMSR